MVRTSKRPFVMSCRENYLIIGKDVIFSDRSIPDYDLLTKMNTTFHQYLVIKFYIKYSSPFVMIIKVI